MYAAEVFLLLVIPYSVILTSLQYNILATVHRGSIMTRTHGESVIAYGSL